jgi:hypothetical protein
MNMTISKIVLLYWIISPLMLKLGATVSMRTVELAELIGSVLKSGTGKKNV